MYQSPINANIHYFALMNPLCCGGLFADANKFDWVECVIDESIHKVADEYKVTLVPLNPNYASRDFYQSDFQSLMRQGSIIEKTNDTMHIVYDEVAEQVAPGAFIRTKYSYVTEE